MHFINRSFSDNSTCEIYLHAKNGVSLENGLKILTEQMVSEKNHVVNDKKPCFQPRKDREFPLPSASSNSSVSSERGDTSLSKSVNERLVHIVK